MAPYSFVAEVTFKILVFGDNILLDTIGFDNWHSLPCTVVRMPTLIGVYIIFDMFMLTRTLIFFPVMFSSF